MGAEASVKRGCKVSGCERPHKGHGLCRVHLMRLRATGSVHADRPIRERKASSWLVAHTRYEGPDCLIWPFTRGRHGYGSVSATVVGRGRGNIGAARAMCILVNGEPPSPKHVAAHSCGKGHEGCVHPGHLRWATQAENLTDMLHHGTARTLTNVGRRQLTAIQIKAVRHLDGLLTDEELARAFGVTPSVIGFALAGQRQPSPIYKRKEPSDERSRDAGHPGGISGSGRC